MRRNNSIGSERSTPNALRKWWHCHVSVTKSKSSKSENQKSEYQLVRRNNQSWRCSWPCAESALRKKPKPQKTGQLFDSFFLFNLFFWFGLSLSSGYVFFFTSSSWALKDPQGRSLIRYMCVKPPVAQHWHWNGRKERKTLSVGQRDLNTNTIPP